MQKLLDNIDTLMTVMGQEVLDYPQIPLDEETIRLRHRLIAEENDEMLDNALIAFKAREDEDEAKYAEHLVEVGDALIDTMVVLIGTYHAYGFGKEGLWEKLWDEVQGSNMSKLGEDGKPILREDGKFLKGPNYYRPNLKSIIYEHLLKRLKDEVMEVERNKDQLSFTEAHRNLNKNIGK